MLWSQCLHLHGLYSQLAVQNYTWLSRRRSPKWLFTFDYLIYPLPSVYLENINDKINEEFFNLSLTVRYTRITLFSTNVDIRKRTKNYIVKF
jgi:hypothetical protein